MIFVSLCLKKPSPGMNSPAIFLAFKFMEIGYLG